VLSIAEYLENNDTPSRVMTASAIRAVLAEVRTAASIEKLVSQEFGITFNGLGAIIDRLSQIAKTLNPQDESRISLEYSIQSFQGLKAQLASQFKDLSSVSI